MKEYALILDKKELLDSPIDQFGLWFEQAQDEIDRTAMTLATVNSAYDVTARMVLLKSFDQKGFVFFTNYLSPKAQALNEIPKAALVFWWPLSQRQVRITGTVALLDAKGSDDYFGSRSRDSRIAAIISKQSHIITSRDDLIKSFDQMSHDLEGKECFARPDYWGGYILDPLVMEFWQGREHRLHDRFQYRKMEDKWEIVRLSP